MPCFKALTSRPPVCRHTVSSCRCAIARPSCTSSALEGHSPWSKIWRHGEPKLRLVIYTVSLATLASIALHCARLLCLLRLRPILQSRKSHCKARDSSVHKLEACPGGLGLQSAIHVTKRPLGRNRPANSSAHWWLFQASRGQCIM